jgi:superoxide dismutase, Fe-Mn family
MITAMPLNFAANALSPDISADTFAHHHGKHFAAYIKTANKLIAGTPAADLDLEAIVRMAERAGNTALFNAAGQVWNHGFFWASLSPPGTGRPAGALATAIERDFGSFDKLASQFIAAGTGQFGSGWVWLVAGGDGRLSVMSTPDAMPVWIEHMATPLLVCDVWEHAYYLDWHSDRGSFLKAFIAKLANWTLAQDQYAAAIGAQGEWCYPAERALVTA